MDLLTIAAPAADVPIGDQTISVRGVSFRAIASILARFPDVLTLFAGRDLDLPRFLAAAPDAAAAIMAAGAGRLNDPAAEAACDQLGLQYQLSLLMKIMELTFPSGIGPFVEAMERLGSSLPASKANGAAEPGHGTPAMN